MSRSGTPQAWRIALAAFALTLSACATGAAPAPVAHEAVVFAAASPEQGAAILSANDEYLSVLSPADLSIRLEGRGGTGADLGRVYAAATQAWSADETARLQQMVQRHRARLDQLAPWLPDTVYFIKGSAAIEGGIPHTRGAAIFFGPRLPPRDQQLDAVFLHELFHVLSRHSAARRDELYGVIGFVRCPAVLPRSISDHLITNPDAPAIEHAAPVSESDPDLMATPLLFASPVQFDPAKTNLGQYFLLRLRPLRRAADGSCHPTEAPGLSEAAMGEAIFARAGHNTDYLFHPEELLADNFAQMMLGAPAPDPWVHQRLAALLGVDAGP